MHENQGMVKIGKTLVVNPGPAYENKAAMIEYGKKINVTFIKL
jgi:Icc-related predicted phosphoesterase